MTRLVGLAAVLAGVMLVSPSDLAARQAAPVRDLVLGQTIEDTLPEGRTHLFRISATAGDFVRIVVEQRGIDVLARLKRPDGSTLVEVDSDHDDFRPETVSAMTDATGPHVLEISPRVVASPARRYRARVDALAPPTVRDQVWLKADREFDRGKALTAASSVAEAVKGLDVLQSALELYVSAGDRQGELKTLLHIGAGEVQFNRPGALAWARKAEAMARTSRDDAALAWALRSVGQQLFREGDRAEVLKLFEEALTLSRGLDHTLGEAMALHRLGIVYSQMADPERSIARSERALALYRAAHYEPGVPVILNNLAIAYRHLGQLTKAIDVYQEALALLNAQVRPDPGGKSNLLNNLASARQALGEFQPALEMLLTSLAIAREIGNKEHEARALMNIGTGYSMQGDYAKALEHQRSALAIRRQLPDVRGLAQSLSSMGETLRRLGDHAQAFDSLHEALSIWRRLGEQDTEVHTLEKLAALARDRGRFPEALAHIKAAVELEETLRARITSPELRASFGAEEFDTYELYIDLLQQQHAAEPSAGHARAALEVSERARARVLIESLLDAQVDLRQGIEPALLERERQLQKQLNDASAALARATGPDGRREPPAAVLQAVERLTNEFQQHVALIRKTSPRYAAMTQPEPLDATTIQRTILDDNTVLLEFALAERRSWRWAVTPDSLTSVALPAHDEIDAATRTYYEHLTARQRRANESNADYQKRVADADTKLTADAAALGKMLLGDLAPRLQNEWRGKRLAIVASGSLEYLPFGALRVPGRNGPLNAQHEIVKIPSASVLAVLRREAASRPTAVRQLAVVADPVFEAGDPRVASTTRSATRTPDPTEPSAEMDESRYLRAGLSRLPFSREEANAIAALVDPKLVLKAVDFSANRAAVLRGALAGHRIVHFATHGVLDSERPALSGLVLSLVDERGRRQNGFLRLHDIYNLRLDADLVVLSACQTALGKDIKGEGLIGLTRAFMYAGAPRVVASLWEVNDLATAELMKRFYRGLLQQKLTPAAALRAAQIDLAKDPRWASPYYWAGFVYQGDWK